MPTRLLSLALLSALLAFAIEPDVPDIINRSSAAMQADFNAAPQFSYIDKDTIRKLDSQGRVVPVSSETYEVTMIEGSPYRRLIARDGKPLSKDEQEAQAQKLQAAVARRRNESPGQRASRIAKYQKSREDNQFMLREMTRAFSFKLTGDEKLDGRDVYVLDARPRPGYRPPNEKAKALTGMQGTLWVDKETCQWVKVVAEVTHPVNFGVIFARLEPGTRILLEQIPVENGIWLTQKLNVKVNTTYLLFFGRNSDEEDDYSGYRRIVSRASVGNGER